MKLRIYFSSTLAIGLALTLSSSAASTRTTSSKPAAHSKTSAPSTNSVTNVVAKVVQVEIPQSVFVISTNPKEGRNPFFPESTVKAQSTRQKESYVDLSAFVLNGITSPPKRTAMINGRTFEVGESGEIKLRDGRKTLVKCEVIKDDSAIILVEGQRRELHLRLGL